MAYNCCNVLILYLAIINHLVIYVAFKKSLKIQKRYSESVNRRTGNTMAKSKKTKGQRMIYKTLHRTPRSCSTNPTKTGGEL